jgi:hypothetical protein
MRLVWCERYGEIGNVSQACREFGLSRKTSINSGCLTSKKVFLASRIALSALKVTLGYSPSLLWADDEEFYNLNGLRKPAKRGRKLACYQHSVPVISGHMLFGSVHAEPFGSAQDRLAEA